MIEKELSNSVLKVVLPYEGSAFVVDPAVAVSCIHVCVQDGKSTEIEHEVKLEYLPEGSKKSISFHGYYQPEESDPDHDIALIRLKPPAGIIIPPAPLSLDAQPEEEVVALGFPNGQQALDRVEGVIFDKHTVGPVTFDDGTILEVLRIDTRSRRGFWGDREVRSGMSGGPILNKRTGTVVAVVEGKRPRGSLRSSPPDGYGIELKHLKACSPGLSPFIRETTPFFKQLQPRHVHPLLPAPNFQHRPEFDGLCDWWKKENSHGVLALIGIGGAGKTTIVQRFLSKLPHSGVGNKAEKLEGLPGSNAVFVWSFYEKPDVDAFCTALYEYLTHKAPKRITDFDLQKALEQWQGGRALLVLDGLEKTQIAATFSREEKLTPFGTFKLTYTPLKTLLRWMVSSQLGVSAIITSRFPLTDLYQWENTGYTVINVDDLPLRGALTLLRNQGVKGNDSDLERLLDRFGKHALTLSLLGGALSAFCNGDPKKATELQPFESVSGTGELEYLSAHLVSVLSFYEKNLPKDELLLLQRLCMFRTAVTTDMLTHVYLEKQENITNLSFKSNSTKLMTLLLSLCNKYRIVYGEPVNNPKRFSAHPTVQKYFSRGQWSSQRRYVAFYLRFSKENSDPDQASQRQALEEQFPNLDAAMDYCLLNGWWEEFLTLERQISGFLEYSGRWHYWEHRLLGCVDAAEQAKGRGFSYLGIACEYIGDYDSAIHFHENAVEIARKHDNLWNLGNRLGNLANVYSSLGYYERARSIYEEALQNRQTLNDRRGIGVTLANLGDILWQFGRRDEAEARLVESKNILQDTQDRINLARTLLSLSDLYLETKPEEAERLYRTGYSDRAEE